VLVRAAGICAQTLESEARAPFAGSVRRSQRYVDAVHTRARCVARAELLALACGSGAAVVQAAAPSAMRLAVGGGASCRLVAAVVHAEAPSAVPGAALGGADGRLVAPVVLAAAPSAVPDAVRRATGLGRLVTAIELASLAASVRDAVGGGAGCELYAPLELAAAAAHVHTAPAKPAPPPRRRERRALPVCLVYDVSHAVPRNASRTRGG
jgi:hypothetical protein